MHPKLVKYFECLNPENSERLNARRPVGPALHASISAALANFALHIAPNIIRQHHGTVIYAGGDDLLALLPVETALPCALALVRAYRNDWVKVDGRELFLMGVRATISGGLVIVHAKDDLRLALQDARAGEERAKAAARMR